MATFKKLPEEILEKISENVEMIGLIGIYPQLKKSQYYKN